MDEYRITLKNSTATDYDELEKVLKRSGINVSIQEPKYDGTEMGGIVESLIILLPLLTPSIIQLRKALHSYFIYKKSQQKKIFIILEKNGKRMEIKTENTDIPGIEDFENFFCEDHNSYNDLNQ